MKRAARVTSGLGVILSALVCCLQPGAAQAAYPDHTIKAIVPFDVGGASDILGRLAATYLGKQLGQTIVVENKPGAGGNLGIQVVTEAKPDGYTVLVSSTATTENPALFRHMPYDPLTDIIPVAQLGESPLVVAVSAAKVPSKTLAEFLDYIRKNPGKLNISVGGAASGLFAQAFKVENNLDFLVVNYKSTGDAVTAMLTGEADFVIADPSPLISVVSSGKVRPLAITGTQRSTAFPDVPTTAEAGLPSYVVESHFGLYVPAHTPPDVVQKLNAAMRAVAAMPEVKQQLQSLGWTPVSRTQAEFDAFYRAEIVKWKDVAKKANIPTLD